MIMAQSYICKKAELDILVTIFNTTTKIGSTKSSTPEHTLMYQHDSKLA